MVTERKITGITFVNPNIAPFKYKRNMEIEAVNTIGEYIENYHRDCIISEGGLVPAETMPSNGASPDRLMSYSCCNKA